MSTVKQDLEKNKYSATHSDPKPQNQGLIYYSVSRSGEVQQLYPQPH